MAFLVLFSIILSSVLPAIALAEGEVIAIDKPLYITHSYPSIQFAGDTSYAHLYFVFELNGDILVTDDNGNKLAIQAYSPNPKITQEGDIVIQDYVTLQILYDFSRKDNIVKITYKGDYKGIISIPIIPEVSKEDISSKSEVSGNAINIGKYSDDGIFVSGISYNCDDAEGAITLTDNSINIIADGIFNIDPSIVGTTTGTDRLGAVGHRETVYAEGRHWVFYGDGTNWGWRTSTDGVTWGNFTAIGAGTGYDTLGTIFYDGTYLHYLRGGIYYRRGDLESNGSISWSASEQTVASGDYFQKSICVNTSGYPYLAVYNNTASRIEIWGSSTNDGTWSTAAGFPYQPVANNGRYAQVVPLIDGDILAIQVRGSSNDIYSLEYDASAGTWGGALTVNDNSSMRAIRTISATAYNGTVYLTWVNSVYDIYCDQYNGTSWGTNTLVYAGTDSTITSSISLTNTDGDIRIFWINDPSANHVYYKNRISSVWDANPTDWITDTAIYSGVTYGALSAYESLNLITGVVYINGSANPYEIKYDYLDDTPLPSNVYLTTSSGSGGNCTTPAEGTWAYNVSEVVNISATADACYHFVNWTGNTTDIGDVNAISTNISMGTTNKTATANFAINTSVITYNANAHGSITGDTPQTINCGDSTTEVTAVPDACYHFTTWDDANTSASRTDIGTSTNQTFTASFAIDVFTLTYSAGANGAINGSSPQNVNCGDNGSEVLAEPDACYHFVDWSDSSTDNPRTDTNVSANISVTANFAIDTFTLTYTAGANGSIVGSSPQVINCHDNGSQVEAVPDACYHFVNWSDASTQNPRTDTNITSNLSVTANFAINVYTLTYNAGLHGTINGTSPQTVNCSDNGSEVLAEPDACYHFVNWSDSSTDNPRTDLNISANLTVTANFAIDVFTLNVSSGANGNVTTPSEGLHDYNCGDVVDLVASPDIHYWFDNWSGDTGTIADVNDSTTTITMTANCTIVANFILGTDLFPPTNISINQTSSMCIDMDWTMGFNAVGTLIIICEDIAPTSCTVPNISNLAEGCYVLYNGSATNASYCGIDTTLHTYYITLWGTDGAGHYSATCEDEILGGADMVDAIYWWMGLAVAGLFTVISFWQKKTWVFYIAGTLWLVLGIFSMVLNTTADMFWYFGFVYLAIGLICVMAGVWFRDKPEPEEDGRRIRYEKRQEKINKLRNLD